MAWDQCRDGTAKQRRLDGRGTGAGIGVELASGQVCITGVGLMECACVGPAVEPGVGTVVGTTPWDWRGLALETGVDAS
jgi:hypothetical protein